MKKICGAVVGVGYWGPNLVRNFLKIPSVEIKAVYDISTQALHRFIQDYKNIKTTNNFSDILNVPEITFVALATPLATHFQLAQKLIASGKHILIEKPMTQTSRQAKKLIHAAKKKQVIIMVGHTFIYSDAVSKMKKVIEKRSFGQLLYFDSTRINLGRFQADANVIWDLAPHDLSILLYLFAEMPLKVYAMGSSHVSKNITEVAHIFLMYKNNFTAHIHVSWLSPVKIRNILIGGSNQMILYNDIEPSEKIRVYNKSVTLVPEDITPFTPAYRSGNVVIPAINQAEALFNQLIHFIDCIKKNKQPITDVTQGLKVVELLEKIDKAITKSSTSNTNEYRK